MKFHLFFILTIVSLLPARLIQAQCCDEIPKHYLFIGPEIYRMKRSREGGTEQIGCLFGARVGYDYIKRYNFYFGFDGLYAKGCLKGHSGDGDNLKSTFTDANIEGRVGYTFQSKNRYHFSLTPFLGFGYFWETNCYQHPSPNHFHFKNTFYYIPIGFLSQFFINPSISIGLNFKARFLIDGKNKVSHDEEFDNSIQHYEEKIQYRVELPINYYCCWFNQNVALGLTPFYEYRHYGYRANFPFDFFDTQFQIYGLTFKLFYLF